LQRSIFVVDLLLSSSSSSSSSSFEIGIFTHLILTFLAQRWNGYTGRWRRGRRWCGEDRQQCKSCYLDRQFVLCRGVRWWLIWGTMIFFISILCHCGLE
jgi:hypothetical protein